MQTIYLHNKPIKLDPTQLIQAGGEGIVFRVQDTAVKLYHTPNKAQQRKLHYFFKHNLAQNLPPNVFAPDTAVTDQQQQIIGFQMPLLPPHSHPLKKLANPLYRQKQNIPIRKIVSLLTSIHHTITKIHQQQLIIGDLNDSNITFTPLESRPPSFIDVDSYQFSHFPCPVATLPFVDPHLYGVADFSKRPYFSEATDWYAYTVLLIKSLLGTHPYGGTHKQHKSLQTRAQNRISILNKEVIYPQNALPKDTLSDDLLQHIHQTFDQNQRHPFPRNLLNHLLRHSPSPRLLRTPSLAPPATRTLYQTPAFIEHLTILPNGRILAITQQNNQYTLIRLGIGGKTEETPLFEGRIGYRFALFNGRYLTINPPQSKQLLLLDVHNDHPQQLCMLETAYFRDTAVFAATPQHLYRIASNWIMQGTVRNGQYLEDPIATAHKKQTTFHASPYNDTLAGFHRIFADYQFFVQTNQGSFDLPIPSLAFGEHIAETGIAFGEDTVAIILQINHKKQLRSDTYIFSLMGKLVNSFTVDGDHLETAVSQYPVTNQIEPGTIALRHPKGTILQTAHSIQLLANRFQQK